MAALPMEKQRALMRGFSGEHKVQLWNEKFRSLLTEVNLTDNEKSHLQKLFVFLSPEHYDTQSDFAELQAFVQEWSKEAEENLGWGEKEFFLYASTLFTIAEFNEYVISARQKYMERDDDQSECECLYSWYCTVAHSGAVCSTTTDCNVTEGCGILGTSNCRGICK